MKIIMQHRIVGSYILVGYARCTKLMPKEKLNVTVKRKGVYFKETKAVQNLVLVIGATYIL